MLRGFFGNISQRVTQSIDSNASLKKSSLGIIIFLVVLGIDKAVEKNLFNCPTTYYRPYGLMFLFGPSTLMFAVGFLTSKYLVSGLQGCWKAKAQKIVLMRQICKCTLVALASFVIYLGIALMQKDYYICFKVGPKPDVDSRSKAAVESQLIAWGLFICLIAVVIFAMLIKICFLMEPQADPKFESFQMYEKLEAKAAAKCFNDKVALMAEERGNKTVSAIFAKFDNNSDDDNDNGDCDAADIIQKARNLILQKYPRGTGDLSMPFRSKRALCSCETEEICSCHAETEKLLPKGKTERQALDNFVRMRSRDPRE